MASDGETEREQDRERGILNDADRKWLLMDRDEYIMKHSRQYWGQRRDEVRKRVRNGILDFTLLFEHLEHDQREELFGGRLTPHRRFDDPDFEAGVRDTLAFMLDGTGIFTHLDEWETHNEMTGERLLEEAFARGAWRWGHDLQDFQLEVVAERIPVRELLQRLDAGESLTVDELARLAISQHDRVDPAVLQASLREQLLDEDDASAKGE